jgi:hypothetical protein
MTLVTVKIRLLATAVMAVLVGASCARHQGTLVFRNDSGEGISRITVAVCGRTLVIDGLKPAETRSASYRICEGHPVIEAEFTSGRHLRKDGGYITTGINIRHEMSISPDDIRLDDTTLTADPFWAWLRRINEK